MSESRRRGVASWCHSYMYVPGPRKKFAGDPNRPTDAEKVEAYNSLVAATGA